jgi:hypothetical protein
MRREPMRFARVLLAPALLLALTIPVIAGESGPKVGWGVKKFEVQDITGPHKGKTVCYV